MPRPNILNPDREIFTLYCFVGPCALAQVSWSENFSRKDDQGGRVVSTRPAVSCTLFSCKVRNIRAWFGSTRIQLHGMGIVKLLSSTRCRGRCELPCVSLSGALFFHRWLWRMISPTQPAPRAGTHIMLLSPGFSSLQTSLLVLEENSILFVNSNSHSSSLRDDA